MRLSRSRRVYQRENGVVHCARSFDEQILADTVEGFADLHEIVGAIICAALSDEALATTLEARVVEMHDRLGRLKDRVFKRRQIAKDDLVKLDPKKLVAPEFTASIRSGAPPDRQRLASDLRRGTIIAGVSLSKPEPILSVKTR